MAAFPIAGKIICLCTPQLESNVDFWRRWESQRAMCDENEYKKQVARTHTHLPFELNALIVDRLQGVVVFCIYTVNNTVDVLLKNTLWPIGRHSAVFRVWLRSQ